MFGTVSTLTTPTPCNVISLSSTGYSADISNLTHSFTHCLSTHHFVLIAWFSTPTSLMSSSLVHISYPVTLAQGLKWEKKYRYDPFFPFPFLPSSAPLPLLPTPSFYISSPLLSPPLISKPHKSSTVNSPSRVRVEPRPQTHFCHSLRLGNVFGCKNFNGFHTGMAVGHKEVAV